MSDPNALRTLILFWEPGQEPTFDQEGWALWELESIFGRCLELIDIKKDELVEEEADPE